MRIFVYTQTLDADDPTLGFFHVWVERLARHAERLTVVCLKKGRTNLPGNVDVLSLGKETRPSRMQYLSRFYRYTLGRRRDYDAVFVHMNPEYAILGGLFWRLFRKPVLFWYTHKAVNLRLRLAEKLVDKIFTASKESFRLPSRKVEVVGHGIPVDFFSEGGVHPPDDAVRMLSVGRVTPSKDLETVLKAVDIVQKKRPVVCSIVGSPVTESDKAYAASLSEYAARLRFHDTDSIGFRNARAYEEMPGVYRRYQILIHTSRTGSMDKTVLEALASGLYVVTSSEAFADLGDLVYRFRPNHYDDLAAVIEKIIFSGIVGQRNDKGAAFVREHHNLDTLVKKIIEYLSVPV